MLRLALLASLSMFSLAYACDETEGEQDLWTSYERTWAVTDEERRPLLARAQGAWLDYREASCEMNAAREGLMAADAYDQCRRFMADERVRELRLICRTATDDAECDAAP